LKVIVFIFILGMLAAGLVLAEQNDTLSSRAFETEEAGYNFAYTNDPMTARTIGERTIDLLGLFDSSESGESARYSVELDLENEDSDWSFEVTVTLEF
jgi:hypothetical protein